MDDADASFGILDGVAVAPGVAADFRGVGIPDLCWLKSCLAKGVDVTTMFFFLALMPFVMLMDSAEGCGAAVGVSGSGMIDGLSDGGGVGGGVGSGEMSLIRASSGISSRMVVLSE